ncbi:MAG: HDIG domain-containing protein [Chloroflexi bacterium]|nr:HDIG domain-containing protein [Chloroflexota bacterium]
MSRRLGPVTFAHLDTRRQSLLGFGTFGGALAAALFAILAFHLLPGPFNVEPGSVARMDFRSPAKVSFPSNVLTREEQERAQSSVADVYDLDTLAARVQQQKLADAIERTGQLRDSQFDPDARRRGLQDLRDAGIGDRLGNDLLVLSEASWSRVRTETLWLFSELMRARFTEAQVPERIAAVTTQLSPELSPPERALVADLLRAFARPTLLLNAESTARARQQARDAVKPVRVNVERGEMILREGDVVRAVDVEKLEAAGLRGGMNWNGLAGTTLLTVLLVVILVSYLVLFQPALATQPRKLLLLGVIVVGATLAAKVMVPGRDLYGYFFPAAAVGMLVTTLIEAHLGIVVSALFAMVLGVIGGFSFELTAIAVAGSLIGILGVWRRERLHAIFVAGLAVATVNASLSVSFHLLSQGPDVLRLALLVFVALANGALSALLTIGGYSVLGNLFGVTTALGLLELAHPAQPLFRRLLTDTPGTYHHSAVVANLAERAAGVVGADALLCRVAAYYHDIGKTLRPYCFVENQARGENVHDRLSPETSAQLIIAHVTDGLELARQYRLPEPVRDVIAQHHGTRLVTFFYHRASQQAGRDLDERDFRYPGPKPQTKEAGLIMLADTVEAMARSGSDHSRENLGFIIDRAVSTIVAEGQLDECDLTLRDLAHVRVSFLEALASFYHPRVEYPGAKAPEAPMLPEPEALISGGPVEEPAREPIFPS